MSKYFSIGEVSKIKGVNIKSLRYYDEIGVLKPAYVNKENGYRYYTPEQLLTVDMIQFCITLDIPLKNWPQYLDSSGQFNLRKLLDDGKKIAYEKIKAIQYNLNKIEIAVNGMENTDKYKDCRTFYRRNIGERHLLCLPLRRRPNPGEFQVELAKLFQLAVEVNATPNYPTGILMDYTPSHRAFYIFIEIYETLTACPYFRCIPANPYWCVQQKGCGIYDAPEKYPSYFKNMDNITVIESDFVTFHVQFQKPLVELQFLHRQPE